MTFILSQALPTVPDRTSTEAVTALVVTTQPSGSNDTLSEQLGLDTTLAKTEFWSGWGVLLLGIFLGIVGGKVLSTLAKGLAKRLRDRGWDNYATIADSAAGPVNLWAITIGLTIGLAPISLSLAVRSFSNGVLKLLVIIAIGWFMYEVVSLIDVVLKKFVHSSGSTFEKQIIPLVRKTLRIFLVVVFVLFAAQNVFGADIGAWLAGLGIAGLAVSLAAQDSIKNLFGSLTIFLDKPFAVGERIIFDGHDGAVEEIGFRSTKLRTLNGEVVTIPNSKIIDASVKNIGRRPNILRTLTIGLTYDTKPEQMELAIAIVREIFAMPDIQNGFNTDKNPPKVFFDAFSPSSLDLKVQYWFFPGSDWWAYVDHAQRFNFEMLKRFNDSGLQFAFPTQTLMLARDEKKKDV